MAYFETKEETEKICADFWEKLSNYLREKGYLETKSKAKSRYLVPSGTENEITWMGKPEFSFRYSNHWNFYTDLKNNPNPNAIQCLNPDIAPAYSRKSPEKGSRPVKGIAVAFYFNGHYRTICGQKYDLITDTWSILDNEFSEEFINRLLAIADR